MAYTAVDYEIDYPEGLSRWLWLVKGLLAFPHLFILAFFGYFVGLVAWVAMWVLLFTGRYPKGIFDMVESYARWQARVNAYQYLLRDEYPPFSGDEEPSYHVRVSLKQPMEGDLSRWLWLFKWILVLPNMIAWFFYLIAAVIIYLVAGWVILFTGKLPRGMFNFIAGANYWNFRIQAYVAWGTTDVYPPFSGAPSKEIN